MKHRLYITQHIFITYVYELKEENHPSNFFIPPQALAISQKMATYVLLYNLGQVLCFWNFFLAYIKISNGSLGGGSDHNKASTITG
jgi:hypothetical protein